jgi:glycerol-3-phosphate acyltransferase PlsX
VEKIGVDLISGENDIRQLMKGVFDALEQDENIEVAVIGKRDVYEQLIDKKIKSFWKKEKNAAERISIIEASDVISMNDNPLRVVKQKKDSSIVKGLEAHKSMEIDAFFSPGNTGAIVVASALIMGRPKGIKKPALGTLIPNMMGTATLLLDVGASAEADEYDLLKFAIMGRIYYREIFKVQNPSVALLNIGEEAHKGASEVQKAYKIMSNMDINFLGNVEGTDLFSGKTNIVVCDGSVGNTSLKVMEGSARTIVHFLGDAIKHSMMAKAAFPLYMSALKELKGKLDPEVYGGAPLLGIKGNVFIGHGSSGRGAITNGILAAAEAVRRNILGKMHERFEELGLK